MNTFTETQRFRQWWVWIIIGFIAIILISSLLAIDTESNPEAWIMPIPLLLVILLLYTWRLDSRYDSEGIHYRVLPLTGWRTISWSTVAKATVTTYGFVGYGIRWNFGEWVYNVAGDQGLRIQTTNGKRIVIGTQRPDELRAFLAAYPTLTTT